MSRCFLLCLSFFFLNTASLSAPHVSKDAKQLSVSQIIEENVKARGGLKIWRKVQTLVMSGTLYTGRAESPQIPIVIQLKRPNMNRQEMTVRGQKLVQAFNGISGWKIRNFHGQNMIAPYGPEDAASARAWQDFLAPLADYAQRNIHIEFDGIEKLNGKPAYRLRLTRPDQSEQRLWIDAKSFLDVKFDDSLRLSNGKIFYVSTVYTDYRAVDGVQIPSSMEIYVQGGKAVRKMVFRQIAINSPIDDSAFARPKNPPAPPSVRRR